MTEDDPSFTIGERRMRLSDLALVTTLGVGTFGRVYLSRFRSGPSGQVFALKVMKKSLVLHLKQVEHVRNERNILRQVASPFVPRLFASFQSRSCLYFLSEYVIGGELFKRLREAGLFPNDVALFYATEIVSVFSYLHSRSIAYRDLKPENVLLDEDGHVKLVDFGFAKVVEGKTYTLCGTPEYLAPESIEHKGHDHGVDWWAFGIFVFEMLTGCPPFYDDNPYNLYQKIIQCQYEFPPNFLPDAADLITQLLDTDRFHRLGVRGGTRAVKTHPWFVGVDFESVERHEIPAPWVPDFSSSSDYSNFDQYPDSSEAELPVLPQGPDPFQDF